MDTHKLAELLELVKIADTNTLMLPDYVSERAGIFVRHVNYGAQRGRDEIIGTLGELYKHRDYNAPNMKLTVAGDKDIAKVAEDVKRKLLPELHAQVAKANASWQRDANAEANRTKVCQRIAEVTRGKCKAEKLSYEGNDSEPRLLGTLTSNNYLAGRVGYGGETIHIETTLSTELALRVLALIYAANTEESRP